MSETATAGTIGRAAPEIAVENILRGAHESSGTDGGDTDTGSDQNQSGERTVDAGTDTAEHEDTSELSGSDTSADTVPGVPAESGDTDQHSQDEGVEQREGESDSAETDGGTSGNTLADLAEKLEMKVKDLYDVEIPMGDGEPMKLGVLKDLAIEAGDVAHARAELDERTLEQDNQILAARAEMGQMMSMLGEAVTPQLLERARSEMSLMVERERRATLEAIPEWQDQDTYARDRESIHNHMREYGISASEISKVHDHRILKMIKDATRDRDKIRGALANASTIRKAPGKPGSNENRDVAKQQDKAAKLQRAKTGNTQDKTAAVSALIGR